MAEHSAEDEAPTPRMVLVERHWRVVGDGPGQGWIEKPGTSHTEAWVRECAARHFPGEPLEYRETWVTEFVRDTRVIPPGSTAPSERA